MEDHHFTRILWYIWKGRNNKVFSNLDMDSRDTLSLAETESKLWVEAQVKNIQQVSQQVEVEHCPKRAGRWCFIDGSWKDKEQYSG